VTNHYSLFHRYANGKHDLSASTQAKGFDQGILECNYPMGPPYWGSARKVGEDTLLGMKAEVFEVPVLGRRYWVVDHPVLGAFSAKWCMGGGIPETNEVIRLEVRQ
jgi:hypothetical protein